MPRIEINHCAIIGAGAWGTALAISLSKAGRSITLWAHRQELADTINATHKNADYLGETPLPENIKATADLEEAVETADIALLVVPAQHSRSILSHLVKQKKRCPIVLCAKGIEQKTLALQSEIAEDVYPGVPLAILSGPSFAHEVAKGLPTALTLAAEDYGFGDSLANALSSRTLRLYQTTDIVGAQIGGAVKNVLAIACGIAAGRGLGENARASLVTRGLAEMTRFGLAMGSKGETLMGLSGLGDLVLTCGSQQSRNMSLGYALGEGKSLDQILGARRNITEGIFSVSAVIDLARKNRVDMPIAEAVDAIVNHQAPIEETIDALLTRPLKRESL